jgi:hypothetical protein
MTNPTASLINFSAIDATYPVAGQDNNSQGFRDNFGTIKTALGQSSTEITALQNNAAFKNANNDFGQNTLSNAVYKTFYGVAADLGTVTTNIDVNLLTGPLQIVTLATNPTFTFKNWPTSGKYAAVRMIIFSDGNAVRIPSFSTENAGVVKYATDFPVLPGTSSKGITVGGESLASIGISSPGSGYTSAATVTFSGGGLQTNGTQATGTATYTCVSATVVGGYSGNGYKLNDKIIVNANPGIILEVSAINLTFTANTVNGSAYLKNIPNPQGFRNLAPGVAVSGAGIPPNATIELVNSSGVDGTADDGTVDAGLLAYSVKISANASATATGVTITYDDGTDAGPIGGLIVSSGGNLTLPLGTTSYSTSAIGGRATDGGATEPNGVGARVVMSFGIGGVIITSPGDGYTSPPNVAFTLGGGTNTTTTRTITALTADNPKIIEAFTRDGGANVYIQYIGEFN